MVRNGPFAIAAAALVQRASAAIVEMPVIFQNTYALTEMAVGTPPVNHRFFFDTGSGTSWLVDKPCAEGACRNLSGHARIGYDPKASSSSVDLGVYDSIEYLGGKTAGPAVADQFHVGDDSWNQTFIAANETNWFFIPADGFLGLAFSSIAMPRTQTVVETMIQEGILDEPKFGLYYGTNFTSTGDGPGEGVLKLGGSDEAKYVEGDMTWLPVRKDNNGTVFQLWRSTLRAVSGTFHEGGAEDGAVVEREPIRYAPGKANGVFDTGAGGLEVPDPIANAVYELIGWPGYDALRRGEFMPLCTYFNATWSVTFTFSDNDVDFFNLTMSGEELKGDTGFANREDACVPPFAASGSDGLALFGKQFLRHFYSVFDFGATKVEDYQPRIGFGHLKKEYRP